MTEKPLSNLSRNIWHGIMPLYVMSMTHAQDIRQLCICADSQATCTADDDQATDTEMKLHAAVARQISIRQALQVLPQAICGDEHGIGQHLHVIIVGQHMHASAQHSCSEISGST